MKIRTAAVAALTALAMVGGAAPTAIAMVAAPTPATAPAVPNLFDLLFNDPATPACEWEDGSEMLEAALAEDPELNRVTSRACKWDAGDRGNGIGDSFVVLLTQVNKYGGAELLYIYADGHLER